MPWPTLGPVRADLQRRTLLRHTQIRSRGSDDISQQRQRPLRSSRLIRSDQPWLILDSVLQPGLRPILRRLLLLLHDLSHDPNTASLDQSSILMAR